MGPASSIGKERKGKERRGKERKEKGMEWKAREGNKMFYVMLLTIRILGWMGEKASPSPSTKCAKGAPKSTKLCKKNSPFSVRQTTRVGFELGLCP